MKHIRKCALLLFSALIMLCALTGCHNAKTLAAFEIPENFDTSKTYELTFWAKNDTNNTQKKIYEKAIDEFQALYPNIKITIRQYTNYQDIYKDVITNISTGTTPNICISYPDHIATYIAGENIVVPLDEFMDNNKYGLGGSELKFDGVAKNEVISKYLEEGYFNGCYYTLPFMRSTEACYINKDYVEALGYTVPDVLTWDFIFEVSEAALAKNEDGTYKVNGQNVMIPFIYKSTDNMMIQMLKQRNAGYSDSLGNISIFNDTTREILTMIAPYAKSYAFSTFAIDSYPGNYFNAGQCIFAIDSTAGATWIGTEAPLSDIAADSIVQFETVVRMIPQYDTENPAMISQGPSLCIFNKEDPNEVLASWLFAQYLLTNSVQINYSTTEGYIPVTTKAQNSAEYQDYLARRGEDNEKYYYVKIDATKMLLANVENTFTTAVFNGSTSLRNAAGQLIEDVTLGVRRKKVVDDEFLDAEFERVASLYRLNDITASGVGKRDLGALPAESKALIIVLLVVWAGILAYVIVENVKNAKKQQKKH